MGKRDKSVRQREIESIQLVAVVSCFVNLRCTMCGGDGDVTGGNRTHRSTSYDLDEGGRVGDDPRHVHQHGKVPRGSSPPRVTADTRHARSRRRLANKTLSVFLSALQGNPCIVELDNETVIRGTLESVDDGLNLMMNACVSKDVYGRTRESGALHVRGGSVRFVHLAKGVEPGKAVRDHQKRLDIAKREAYTRQQMAGKREKGAS